jgi:diphthine synthase
VRERSDALTWNRRRVFRRGQKRIEIPSKPLPPPPPFFLIFLKPDPASPFLPLPKHHRHSGLDAIRGSSRVYLEAYTSVLCSSNTEKLEALYGKKVVVATREMVESGAEEILKDADSIDVAFCVVGDPFGATTHSDLQLRAREAGIEVKIVHNASVLNAVGAAGLQLYRYGEAISLCFHSQTWKPDSWYERIKANRDRGLHTLCLLDIKVKEQTDESLAR